MDKCYIFEWETQDNLGYQEGDVFVERETDLVKRISTEEFSIDDEDTTSAIEYSLSILENLRSRSPQKIHIPLGLFVKIHSFNESK